ncbi:MAG TPA: hypothetical protein PLF22_12255 [Pseudomonadales bacterium]|nr:hypothetical protein [Pseudomonadales bacterium]
MLHILRFHFEQYYLPGKPKLALLAVCELSAAGHIARACISDQTDALQKIAAKNTRLDVIAEQAGIALLDFSVPWRLQPVHIAKPWGQEIWYTGIEARGVSGIVSGTGTTPLPWAISLAQQQVLGHHQQPNLLKILDPLPDAVYGDLYFELHEQKREVYIVTHIDERAWPSGIGAIRFGFSAGKRAQFSSDADFLEAYRTAVREYHTVRRDIDAQLDACRERDGIALNAPVTALQTQQWLSEVPLALRQHEQYMREAMERFTAMRDLRVGDVLAVPLRTPHALQHGVRTVEFQTPVYERKILSFAQKVLTQADWDTDEALQLAQLQTPTDEVFPVLRDSDGVKIEQIVQFDDFTVQRIYLASGAFLSCETHAQYFLVMAVTGCVHCGNKDLAAEQAVLVPASARTVNLANEGDAEAVVLLARPA